MGDTIDVEYLKDHPRSQSVQLALAACGALRKYMDGSVDPMAPYLSLIQPGTVLDGEVVLFRGSSKTKARPIFIIFDVLCLNATEPIFHLLFEQRLRHMRQASFRTKTANRDMFADAALADPTVA